MKGNRSKRKRKRWREKTKGRRKRCKHKSKKTNVSINVPHPTIIPQVKKENLVLEKMWRRRRGAVRGRQTDGQGDRTRDRLKGKQTQD